MGAIGVSEAAAVVAAGAVAVRGGSRVGEHVVAGLSGRGAGYVGAGDALLRAAGALGERGGSHAPPCPAPDHLTHTVRDDTQ